MQSVHLGGNGVDFAISASPASEVIPSGHDANYAITVTPLGGFTGSVSLTCSGEPPNSACSIAPVSVALNGSGAGATATITLLPPKNVDHGTFTITFTGRSRGVVHSAQVTLTVK